MIRNISIVLLIITALAGPASAGVVAFSLINYFGNIGDHVDPFTKTGAGGSTAYTNAKPCSDIPNTKEEGFIRDYIIQSANFFELPAGFIAAVMEQESGFRPDATSKVGARGLMQLMPGTYKQLNSDDLKDTSKELAKARGFDKNNSVYRQIYLTAIEKEGSQPLTFLGAPDPAVDIINLKYNTFLGTTYYRQHFDYFSRQVDGHKKFAGEQLYEVMLAGYNAGPGAVNKYNGIPPYPDTQEYVQKIMARYKVYEGCMKTVANETLPEGTVTNDAAQKVKQRVARDPAGTWKQGAGQCAITTAALLAAEFQGRSGTEGASLGSYPNQASTAQPTNADMKQVSKELEEGRIPVWHIVGPNQEHWIAILEVNGSNLTYFEPASGTIETSSITKAGGGGNNYFGITHQGCYQNHERGYGFTP